MAPAEHITLAQSVDVVVGSWTRDALNVLTFDDNGVGWDFHTGLEAIDITDMDSRSIEAVGFFVASESSYGLFSIGLNEFGMPLLRDPVVSGVDKNNNAKCHQNRCSFNHNIWETVLFRKNFAAIE